MLPDFFQFHSPTKVVYGPGLVSDLSTEFENIGIERTFLISDRSLETAGLVDMLVQGLGGSGIEVVGTFLDVPQDSEVKTVVKAAKEAENSKAEGLVALGGGSVMDTAKAANIIFTEGGDLIEDHSGAGTLTRPLKPLVAIPTTAGTGSESTIISVIYDKESKTKLVFSDRHLLPRLAVLDPEMTLTLPPRLTASTGMDALTHAIEATVGIDWSPVSDALAFGAVELIFRNLLPSVENGNDIDARGAMLIAANMAGIAFSHSMVGCVHSMAHTVGGLYRVPHGVANAILLPHGMEYNFKEGKEKFSRLAAFMGEDTRSLSLEESARRAINAVKRLLERLNGLGAIPARLRDVGVPEEDLAKVADLALEDGSSIYNPRELIAKELLVHLKNAY